MDKNVNLAARLYRTSRYARLHTRKFRFDRGPNLPTPEHRLTNMFAVSVIQPFHLSLGIYPRRLLNRPTLSEKLYGLSIS